MIYIYHITIRILLLILLEVKKMDEAMFDSLLIGNDLLLCVDCTDCTVKLEVMILIIYL